MRELGYVRGRAPPVLLAFALGRREHGFERVERLFGVRAVGDESDLLARVHAQTGDDEHAHRGREVAVGRPDLDLRLVLVDGLDELSGTHD